MQPATENLIHVYFEEKQTGPFPIQAVREMMRMGSLNATASVWHEGMADWEPIETFLAAHPETTPPAARVLPKKTGPAWAEAGAEAAKAETLRAKPQRAYGEPNLKMGTIGAVVAGLIGMAVWYGILKSFHFEIGYVAWGVGGLVGFACRVLGGGYSQQLGLTAAVCALVAILGGEFLATRASWGEELDNKVAEAYTKHMDYAKRAVSKETDGEIRAFLAAELQKDNPSRRAVTISDSQITQFRSEEVPELKAFINGRPSKAEVMRASRKEFNQPALQWEILKHSVSLWTALWLFLGVGTAWRLGTGAVE